jgi:divalent metal cation (Fe/Co/Zn/Cd) transporter
VRRVLWWVFVANLVVVVAKLAIGLRAGSIAVLGDAAHSGVDAINNIVALLAIRLASYPPDEEHPYGHGKFETLGALAVVSFLSITCFELIGSAVGRLVSHTAADVMVTAAVLVGLILVRLGWSAADSWLTILVALVIARSGVQILRSTIPVLVDTRAAEADSIRHLVESTPGVLSTSDIRSRGRPGEAFAELTIKVDPRQSVVSAHEIADTVEERLGREAGFAGVVVHVEPLAEGKEAGALG